MTPVDADGVLSVPYPALISTVDEDGSYTLSSVLTVRVFGLRATVDLEATSKTALNMTRTGQCVLNLTSDEIAGMVDRLARLAGARSDPRARSTPRRGRFGEDFQAARLTPASSEAVSAPRALECPVQLEAEVADGHRSDGEPGGRGRHPLTIEMRILRVHIDPSTVLGKDSDRCGSNRWEPLMTCLRKAYRAS